MKSFVCLLFFTFCSVAAQREHHRSKSAHSRVLPVGGAPWELAAAVPPHQKAAFPRLQQESSPPPPEYSVRLPAEFEPVASVVLSSVYGIQDETIAIAEILLDYTSLDLFLVGQVLDPEEGGAFGQLIEENGDRFYHLPFRSESVWTRDFGPVGVLVKSSSNDTGAEDEEKLALVNMRYRRHITRPNDNDLPCHVGSVFADWDECYELELIVDGGNIMSDGRGNLFTTTRTYHWNPDYSEEQVDALLKQYFGVDTIHALDYAKDEEGKPLDNTGHIDMFAKLLGECQVIVVETEPTDPFFNVTQAAADYFSTLSCAENQNYNVTRVKGWYGEETFSDQVSGENVTLRTWYTYANSLIVNDLVLIPSFPETAGPDIDAEALGVYQSILPPQYTVLATNMETPIRLDGAVHCMTRQIPQSNINSPSKSELVFPNVTCAGLEMPKQASCDMSHNDYCQEHASKLAFAATDTECRWNDLFLEHICCLPATERSAVLPQYGNETRNVQTHLLTLRFDDAPHEVAWMVVDNDDAIVASSPFYGLENRNTTLEVQFDLAPGVYTFIILDGNGDGIQGNQEQWVDNLSTGEYLLTILSYDLFETGVLVIPDAERDMNSTIDEMQDGEPPSTSSSLSTSGAVCCTGMWYAGGMAFITLPLLLIHM